MERREILRKSLGVVSVVLVPSQLLRGGKSDGRSKAWDQTDKLWKEGCFAAYFGEAHHAHDLIIRAIEVAPEELETEVHAEMLEELARVSETSSRLDEWLRDYQKELDANPSNLDKRLEVAHALRRLGRNDEADAEFQRVLSRREELAQEENQALWGRVGWFFHRTGRFREAAERYDRAYQAMPIIDETRYTPEEKMLRAIFGECALEKILNDAALGRTALARELTRLYVEKMGRMPWPHRWKLAQAGIDADKMYVEYHAL